MFGPWLDVGLGLSSVGGVRVPPPYGWTVRGDEKCPRADDWVPMLANSIYVEARFPFALKHLMCRSATWKQKIYHLSVEGG